MTLGMFSQMVGPQKTASARSALESLFSSMSATMARKLIRAAKFSAAIVPSTGKRFFSYENETKKLDMNTLPAKNI